MLMFELPFWMRSVELGLKLVDGVEKEVVSGV